ncbi:alcohol dehydrogenase-like regulatory protein ErcA [Geomesophilobacter sediminis]|uniref:Iron-containing alcohol dehydrogenase n=1 Tax=Geomesophilobacter sediminis TaxID=2798584 RepID=A0A8J7IN33_9BACT|nr:alcohol dehydrogenase-like regulatory protein ErcA [Geomesophilobacter sediminis]MBJ6723349.1 iron-containing alcohol dehydrogenase [Geomesophilobacter sediminis]
MDSISFRKFVVPEMIFGNGSFALVDGYAKRFGLKRVLLVSDPGVTEAGWTEGVIGCLGKSGIEAELFNAVSSNPKDREVMAGADCYRAAACDGIVAVGGGSPIDCAKGIGIVCSNGGHILDFEGIDRVPLPMPPLICIPTTAGTAADISQFAIISATQEQRKVAIVSKALVPDLALIDPLTTTTMDRSLTACTGIDALVHAIEAYVSTGGSPLTDLHALEAIRLVSRHLPKVLAQPDNLEQREAMMLASTHAGMAFSNGSLGAVHAMAHSLGGLLDSPHGDCNAQLLEHVVAFNYPACPQRCRRIAEAMGIDLVEMTDGAVRAALTSAIHALRARAGIVGSLADRGVTREMIPRLAANAMQDPCMVTNPRQPSRGEIEAIYVAAL